uniref:Cilia and flagella associated protein 90 n=1 Tax=Leptobrachium leishanense TaxID=445787 RepID=A0A8C5MBV9_9ANUR
MWNPSNQREQHQVSQHRHITNKIKQYHSFHTLCSKYTSAMEVQLTYEHDEAKADYLRRKCRQTNLSSLSAFSHVPVEKRKSKELGYFYQQNKDKCVPTYDTVFKRPQGYNEKLHRDDREHAKHNGLDIHTEEQSRPVPVLSSSEYGRHLQLHVDKANRDHAKIGLVRTDFYRKNGISQSLEEGYGSVIPS